MQCLASHAAGHIISSSKCSQNGHLARASCAQLLGSARIPGASRPLHLLVLPLDTPTLSSSWAPGPYPYHIPGPHIPGSLHRGPISS